MIYILAGMSIKTENAGITGNCQMTKYVFCSPETPQFQRFAKYKISYFAEHEIGEMTKIRILHFFGGFAKR